MFHGRNLRGEFCPTFVDVCARKPAGDHRLFDVTPYVDRGCNREVQCMRWRSTAKNCETSENGLASSLK